MNEKMVLVTAGVSFVVKNNSNDISTSDNTNTTAVMATSNGHTLNGHSNGLLNKGITVVNATRGAAKKQNKNSNSTSVGSIVGIGSLCGLPEELDLIGDLGELDVEQLMAGVGMGEYDVIEGGYDGLSGGAIGKLMEDLSRSVGNGRSSCLEDENFAIEVVFGAKNGKRLKATAGGVGGGGDGESGGQLSRLLSEGELNEQKKSKEKKKNGELMEGVLGAKRREFEELKRWIMDEFKSPPPPLPFTFPPDAEDEELQAGGLENELNGDKNGQLIYDEEGVSDEEAAAGGGGLLDDMICDDDDEDDDMGSTRRGNMEREMKRSIERSEEVFQMTQPLLHKAFATLKASASLKSTSENNTDTFATVKQLNDSQFNSFSDFVLTKLIVSVMDKRRTSHHYTPPVSGRPLTPPPPPSSTTPHNAAAVNSGRGTTGGGGSRQDPSSSSNSNQVVSTSSSSSSASTSSSVSPSVSPGTGSGSRESESVPDYLEDEEFMTEMCYDTMMDSFQQTLCAHLGELARNFDPKQLFCHSLRWFDTQEVLEHSRLLNPYADLGMPCFDAKGRSLNIVMLTELSNILQVHCRTLPEKVYASVAAKLRDKSSGCTASVHDGWMGLVETCGHYGIMLHDFLLTLNRPKDPSTIITTTTKGGGKEKGKRGKESHSNNNNNNWKVLRKCVWLVVSFLKSHPLVKHTLSEQYLSLSKPEVSSAFVGIAESILDYEHDSIPRGFGTNLQPFRFFHWYMNPHLLPSYLSQHLYLHEYIKSQLHCPRVARAWEAIEVRQTTQVRQLQQKALQKQGAGKRAKETQSREQHQCGSDAEVNEKLKEAMHIFVQVERRKLVMNLEKVEAYVAQLRICVVLYEVAYWLKKLFAAKKTFAPDAYYLCWRHFDDPEFFVPISCANHAMRKQYCKREGIYYLVTRFCLNILHYEMRESGYKVWDKASVPYKTFMFLFRRLFTPYAEPDSIVFEREENCYDRYSARILQRMRAIMEREKKTASAAAAAANGGPNSSTTADTHHVNRGYYDLHMENLKLFTNETTQTYVRLEQQVTASLNDVILSAENQKQVDNFIGRVLEALVLVSTDKNVDHIDWPFIGRCVPLYMLDLYKLLAKNNLLGYPSVFAYSTKTFIDKFIHENITRDNKTIDQFFTQQIHDDSRICPFDKVEGNPFVKLALRYFSAEETNNNNTQNNNKVSTQHPNKTATKPQPSSSSSGAASSSGRNNSTPSAESGQKGEGGGKQATFRTKGVPNPTQNKKKDEPRDKEEKDKTNSTAAPTRSR